jgi:tyrosine-specific transport protein
MKAIFGHVLGGMLLVCGTSVGAGMLALPVVTAQGGFFPALFIFFLCYLFMMATGLLLLEISLKMPRDSNIISMATHYFGTKGKVFAWVLYIFLFYLLSTAYISGGGELIYEATNFFISPTLGSLIFCFVLASFVIFGTKVVDRLNLLFMLGLVVTYVILITIGMPYIEMSKISYTNFPKAFIALPIIFTSFSYQGIIPSLTYYMQKDAKKIRLSIILGTSLTFFIYILFEILVLGIAPLENLIEAKTAVYPLRSATGHSLIYPIGQFFAFFAIITSFLGVSLGLFDFFSDGLKIEKKGSKRLVIAGFAFVPPLLIALSKPGLFLIALKYAGGIGCAFLLGLLPTLMVYSHRYIKKEEPLFPQLIGGKKMLYILFLFVVFELIVQSAV